MKSVAGADDAINFHPKLIAEILDLGTINRKQTQLDKCLKTILTVEYKNLLIIIFSCLINGHVNIDISIDKLIDKGSFQERVRTAGAGIYGKDNVALFL